jgi:hypothetical protein
MDLAAERQARERALAKAHQEYLDDNPAAKKLLADFISSALVEQPVDVFEFARNHFRGTATAVVEDDEEDDLGGVDGGDQDDMDDLDEMASGGNTELTAYLKEVFDSIDTDGSGSISQVELKKKLEVRPLPPPLPPSVALSPRTSQRPLAPAALHQSTVATHPTHCCAERQGAADAARGIRRRRQLLRARAARHGRRRRGDVDGVRGHAWRSVMRA